jgi:hypothetical protein
MSGRALRRGAPRPGWAAGLAGAPEVPAAAASAPRLSVTLLAGDGAAGALERWLRERPHGERWAVVCDSSAPAAPVASAGDPDLAIADFAGACACCLGSSAFALFLTRLLRGGPYHRLLVALPASAEPAAVVDGLLGGSLAPALGAVELAAVGAVPAARSETMDALLAADVTWAQAVAALARARDPHPWRWAAPAGPRAAWAWDQHTVFDRRRIEAALAALAADPDVVALRAAVRTAREWYACDPAGQPAWRVEPTRRESRIECAVREGAADRLDGLGARWAEALHAVDGRRPSPSAARVRIARSRNPGGRTPLPGGEGFG